MNSIQSEERNRRYRLPIGRILIGALFITWSSRVKFIKGLLPTAALILATGLVWDISGVPLGNPISVIFIALSMLLFAKFAVTCHRLVLVDFNNSVSWISPFSWSTRETFFLRRVIIVYLLTLVGSTIISMMPLAIVAQSLPEAQRNNPAALFPYATIFAGIPAIYLLARMSLVFPATAVDSQTGLTWAWNISRGNGLRISIIVGLIPWISMALVFYLTRYVPGYAGMVVSDILNFVLVVIELTALSLAYREIIQIDKTPSSD